MRIFLLILLCSCTYQNILVFPPAPTSPEEASIREELIAGYNAYYAGKDLGFFYKSDFPISLDIESFGFKHIALYPVFQVGNFYFESLFPATGIYPLDCSNKTSFTNLTTNYTRGIFSLIFLNFEETEGLANLNPNKFCDIAFSASKENPFCLDLNKLKRDALEGRLNRYSFKISESIITYIPEGLTLISENPFRNPAQDILVIYSGLERFFVFKDGYCLGTIAFFLSNDGQLFIYNYYGKSASYFEA